MADDLENYLETKERAEEIDAKIEQTDELIDEIVYEMYGLTDEEIKIVEIAAIVRGDPTSVRENTEPVLEQISCRRPPKSMYER